MKRPFLLFLLVLGLSCLATAQQVSNLNANNSGVPSAVLELKEAGYDFGKIPQGRPVTHNFDVMNKGKGAISLENVQASCGCTTPEWNDQPIAPGASSIIKVGFNAASEGRFQKSITITYNNGQIKTLTITGEVYPSPTTSAPLNTSLSLIK